MKAFEYAAPTRPSELLELLADYPDDTAILAGGTDLVPLMAKMIVTPRRVVNITGVAGLRGISADSLGVTIGATTTLDELLESKLLADYPSILQAIAASIATRCRPSGTIGGELLQRPQCWYFRDGDGLLADGGRKRRGGGQSLPRDLWQRRAGEVRFAVAHRAGFDCAFGAGPTDRSRARGRSVRSGRSPVSQSA